MICKREELLSFGEERVHGKKKDAAEKGHSETLKDFYDTQLCLRSELMTRPYFSLFKDISGFNECILIIIILITTCCYP